MTSTHSRNKGRGAGSWLLIACVGCAVAGGVVGGVIANAINSPSSSSGSSSTGTATGVAQSTSSQTTGSCQVSQVADKILPSVVTISAKGASGGGTGSGEIIKSDGYILTNNHVIAPAASGGSLTVLFNDGKSAAATLVGRDPLTDIAVIRVDESGLPAIPIGQSSSLIVGQPVVVLGAPLGLSSTVTSGIVSALDRTIQVPGESSQAALLINAIQTDAAINPGNSGGSLVNCDGQFVGVPSAGATVPSESGESNGGSIGLGFAIPSDLAIRESNEIISTGKVSHAYLGVQATPVAASAAKVNGVAEGLIISGIDPSGPAQAAGLAVGDVITSIDGTPAVSTDQLVELSLTKRPGDKVTIGYTSGGASHTATLTLGTQP
ncbi:MAG TPA: trypsin-like peptidase domain-containing protein [Trebonia sp.]|jgi:putative serine protease PepD|nr:trypsin-like peptidase domain-containing protein [Trebonia sp.]